MSDVKFILVYVDDVAASEAFYASILGRGAIEILSHFRHASCRAGPDTGPMEARRNDTAPVAEASGEIAITAADDAEVDRLFAEWRVKGSPSPKSRRQCTFGYNFLALDPDGRRLRFFSP